ncbi:unnamed protein product, partial [Prorocentrum cordatum]
WQPKALRQQEILMLGPSAARRAARRRRLGALEAWCHAVAGPCRPGSWQDRERAARPALVSAVEGRRVAGASRQRRNAALHAACAPPSGFLRASAEEIAEAARGPRLGFLVEAEHAAHVASGDAGGLANRAAENECEQMQWVSAPLRVNWGAKLNTYSGGSMWPEFGVQVIHVAELEPQLLNLAGGLHSTKLGTMPSECEEKEREEALPVPAFLELEGLEDGGELDVWAGGSGTLPQLRGCELAPGTWQVADLNAEAKAFAEGLAAGWRLAETVEAVGSQHTVKDEGAVVGEGAMEILKRGSDTQGVRPWVALAKAISSAKGAGAKKEDKEAADGDGAIEGIVVTIGACCLEAAVGLWVLPNLEQGMGEPSQENRVEQRTSEKCEHDSERHDRVGQSGRELGAAKLGGGAQLQVDFDESCPDAADEELASGFFRVRSEAELKGHVVDIFAGMDFSQAAVLDVFERLGARGAAWSPWAEAAARALVVQFVKEGPAEPARARQQELGGLVTAFCVELSRPCGEIAASKLREVSE